MTDATWGSIVTTAGLVAIAWIQRNQGKKLAAAKDVADETHEVVKIIKTDVNNNWKVAGERIDQLQTAMQNAGIKVPPTPTRGDPT